MSYPMAWRRAEECFCRTRASTWDEKKAPRVSVLYETSEQRLTEETNCRLYTRENEREAREEGKEQRGESRDTYGLL